MPFAPEPLGLAYFAGIKFAGYSAAGVYFRNRLGETRPNGLVFGLARTALGIVAGVAVASILALINIRNTEVLFYVALAPVRMLEWLLTFWFFFGRRTLYRYSLLGSVWSYLLDVPAIMAVFVLPGGAWIC